MAEESSKREMTGKIKIKMTNGPIKLRHLSLTVMILGTRKDKKMINGLKNPSLKMKMINGKVM